MVPISVFVSRQLSRLFVRKGFTPLFDVPIKIRNPAEPMGTHVFSVMEFQNEGAAIRWTVVSIPEKSSLMIQGIAKGRRQHEPSCRRQIKPRPSWTASKFRKMWLNEFLNC